MNQDGDAANGEADQDHYTAVITVRQVQDYYVNDGSTTGDAWCTAAGDDGHSGTDPAHPKVTVQAILDAYDLEPGDVVHIDTGTYVLAADMSVVGADGGSAAAPVAFEASPYGVVIDRGSTAWGSSCFDVSADYVTIRTAEASASGPPQAWMQLRGGHDGAYFDACIGGRVERVDAAANVYGMRAGPTAGTAAHTFANLLLRSNATAGMCLDDADDCHVRNCTFYHNGTYGWTGTTGTTGTVFASNVFCADGAGAYCTDWQVEQGPSDFNLYHVTGGAQVGRYGGDRPTFADWQAATGDEAGSLNADPMFADPGGGDFHLNAECGRYEPLLGTWVTDAEMSPAVDAGNPAADWTLEPEPSGARVNQGAYGNTNQASKAAALLWTGSLSERWEMADNWAPASVPDGHRVTAFQDPADRQPALYQDQGVVGTDFRTAGWTLGGAGHALTVGHAGVDSAGTGTNTVEPDVALADNATWTHRRREHAGRQRRPQRWWSYAGQGRRRHPRPERRPGSQYRPLARHRRRDGPAGRRPDARSEFPYDKLPSSGPDNQQPGGRPRRSAGHPGRSDRGRRHRGRDG